MGGGAPGVLRMRSGLVGSSGRCLCSKEREVLWGGLLQGGLAGGIDKGSLNLCGVVERGLSLA